MLPSGRLFLFPIAVAWALFAGHHAEVLTPPYFNIAEKRKAEASFTCGEDVQEPELYCKLVGAVQDYHDSDKTVISGQICDFCDSSRPDKNHPPSYAVDGFETYWISPPLSRGTEYNQINFTISLGQEFHVAYVIIKMGISPRPGLWVLERSADNGLTYKPWQYFAETIADCEHYFGSASLEEITKDDSVICTTIFSKITPLEHGEIVVSLLNGRPSSSDFFNSTVLQEWTRATNVRLRLLRHLTLFGHLMSVEKQDPTVTRRYFYSIKDISIGGRCRCNGHADVCIQKENDPYILKCQCQHNTCGDNCDTCCENKVQKKWRQSKANALFLCEECNCHGHSETCHYNETVDALGLSMDIHGKMEGGGVCKNCRDNTEGINCEKCKPGFYKPFSKSISDVDACVPCNCVGKKFTGNCEDGTGDCECKSNYVKPDCDACAFGYTKYDDCVLCECDVMGTVGSVCDPVANVCPCKSEFQGFRCDQCSDGYYNFPGCKFCGCDNIGSLSDNCDKVTGECECKNNFAPPKCDKCADGFYHSPECLACSCDLHGTIGEVCNKENGTCLCKNGFDGPRCDQCVRGFKDFPNCVPCNCSIIGSSSDACDLSGKCACYERYSGKNCDQCSPGYYSYPKCLECGCDPQGSYGRSCNVDGYCSCKPEFEGKLCDKCREGFYNYPLCEPCDCVPAGVTKNFSGCGSQITKGLLCECKPRVTGRRCNECKPLYWNLEEYFPEGCIDCDCYTPGVIGGIAECDDKNDGQCYCKRSVVSRQCNECGDGSYNLQENNIFGCTDCGCDIGGALNTICNKTTGACLCKNRIEGRTCNAPLEQHYFPTLHQLKFEMEDGFTPDGVPARYGFIEEDFPNFSWKGYAYFSRIQDSIKLDIHIERAALYRILIRYVNKLSEPVAGTILLHPVSDAEQILKVVFPPSEEPAFVTVSGHAGDIPSPFVVAESNDKQWEFVMNVDKMLLVDYFVLLPSSYFEGNILVEDVKRPCTREDAVTSRGRCLMFSYPSVSFYVPSNLIKAHGKDHDESLTEVHQEDFGDLYTMYKLTPTQPLLQYNLQPNKRGPTVLVVSYYTPTDSNDTIPIDVDWTDGDQDHIEKGKVHLTPCRYAWICRQVVLDSAGRFGFFNFTSDIANVGLKFDDNADIRENEVAIHSIAAIPADHWSPGFIKPSPHSVMIDGVRQVASFPPTLDLKKIEFENEPGVTTTLNIPENLFDKSVGLVSMQENNNIYVSGKVATPGNYIFIVHYSQPFHPGFNVGVRVNNSLGQVYSSSLHAEHCPSNVGCRVTIKDHKGNQVFNVANNFSLAFENIAGKRLWMDYILIAPEGKFKEQWMTEGPVSNVDRYREECGKNHFYTEPSVTSDFCRDSIFSVTTQFNNGALQCMCNSLGSKSLKCNQFGGQCVCHENVIGRRCEKCKMGYYDFPDCKRCSCSERAICDPFTGECSCPKNTEGESCEKCKPNSYGYDLWHGCSECNCDPQGVNGTLQCDEFDGTCACRENIGGRTCSACQPGFHGFPKCEECDCDLRGTTGGICDEDSAECLCKENVEGYVCDVCKEGSFNIDENNKKGCTDCFCFNRTNTCTSSLLYKNQVFNLDDWSVVTIQMKKILNISEPSTNIERLIDSVGVDLTTAELVDQQVYFSAPSTYLGNKITSYGGLLSYTLFCTTGGLGDLASGADIILSGAGLHLLHYSYELPRASYPSNLSVLLEPSNFQFLSGITASREQLMQVLNDLRAIYIRATYWEKSVTTSLSNVKLDTASENYTGLGLALSVEQCQCPPQYTGLSCEECADGYYRSTTGTFGGFCVPCQCNNHADTCDKITGICLNCQHDTVGNHCEMCAEGYHGYPTNGLPDDCLICACPYPSVGRNFATKCEFSDDGEQVSCECKTGYYGDRCETCAVGYYGSPEIEGSTCKPCNCSGNNDIHENGSCDSVTGRCSNCLNNTAGFTCNYCKPWFYGDAVSLKNCQSCSCETCGSSRCNHTTGTCECKQNVVGEKCDRCAENHYGYDSCQGCKPCNCQEASESKQCDDRDGKCRCKPGVTGTTCDRCAEGYWNYTENGCTVCSCNVGYSEGVGCDPVTGTCHCLRGVIGEKCDRCPHRWVLVKSEGGCLECDKCTHDMLDSTDRINSILLPVNTEFDSVALSHFSKRRLMYINETVDLLRPKVEQLVNKRIDLTPFQRTIEELKDAVTRNDDDKNRAWKKANNTLATNLNTDAIRNAEDAIRDARDAVDGVIQISKSFDSGLGPKLGISNLEFDESLKEAKSILENITNELTIVSKIGDVKTEVINVHLAKANKALEGIKKFQEPIDKREDELMQLKNRIQNVNDKIADLKENSKHADSKAEELMKWTKQQKEQEIPKRFSNINELNSLAQKDLELADQILLNVTHLLSLSNNDLLTNFNDEKGEFSINSMDLDNLVRNPTQSLNEMGDRLILALQHAAVLEHQANELLRLSFTDRDDTKAIQAYTKIVNVLRDAMITAEMARNVSETAEEKCSGIGEKAEIALQDSLTIESKAQQALQDAQNANAQLMESSKDIGKLNNTKNDLLKTIDWIDDKVLNIPVKVPNYTVIRSAEQSSEVIEDIMNSVSDTLLDIKGLKDLTKKLIDDKSDGNSAVNQSANFLDEVSNILPGVNDLTSDIKNRPSQLNTKEANLKQTLIDLRKRIERARFAANKINVGVAVQPDTFLELKIPQSLPEQEINNYISLFLRSNVSDGLLLYLGNEQASEKRTKRSINTGDFVALELNNWQLRLTTDLGDGPTSIISDKKISPLHWYQAIIERTGKSLRLTINEESQNKSTISYIKEGIVKGQATVLNIDKSSSKLFVGGMSPDFNHPLSVPNESFNGSIADVVVGDSVVGLWNFEDQRNIQGAERRQELEKPVASTGCRFSGDGWVAIESKPYAKAMERRSQVLLDFRTLARDGLLFLSTQESTFLSIEIREGRILFQWDLGNGHTYIITPNPYNDGEWHHVEITRVDRQGSLRVDGTDIGEDQTPGENIKLKIPPKFYFGGFPDNHDLLEVTNADFDGCIDQVKFDSAADLNQYSEAFGVKPGCPEKVASVVSFEEGASSYVLWPNISRSDNKAMELVLRFKTALAEGLLVYALFDQSSISIRLESGQLVVYHGPNRLLTSQALTPYNDSDWHVVYVTYDEFALKLIVDDSGTYNLPDPPKVRMLHGSLYFGGVPSVIDAEAAIAPKYAGCISDATLNGVIINFGNLTEMQNAIIGKCSLHPKAHPRIPPIPSLKPQHTSFVKSELPMTTSPSPPVEVTTKRAQLQREDNQDCKLPLYPDIGEPTEDIGIKLGAAPNGRLEYINVQPKIKQKYEFSIDVKTQEKDGVLFFTANPRSPDYIAVYLKDGKVNYGWDLGSGEAHLESNDAIDDDKWHTIVFKRHGESGSLAIDGVTQSEGKSSGQTKALNVSAPFYVGGISQAIPKDKQIGLKGTNVTLKGCVRKITLNGHPLNRDKRQRLDFGAIPCSDQYEEGVYISPEGGYIEQKKHFLVGQNFEVRLEIKPRVLSGLILAIHGKHDYLVLELNYGVLSARISSGRGSIINSYGSPIPNVLCDGNWHSIYVTKVKHVVQIGVDSNFATPAIGDRRKQTSIYSNHTLYIGGHPTMRAPGIDTKKQYVGCMRLISINGKLESLNFKGAVGNVTFNACPLN